MKNAKISICRGYLSQRGSALLFVTAVVIPVIFFLFSLSVDLNVYYTRNQRAQKVLDDAVLYGHRFLPSQEAAKRAVQLFVNQNQSELGEIGSGLSVSATSDMITATFTGTAPLNFTHWFGADIKLEFSAYAKARSTPLDVYLALDTGAAMAPGLASTPWGSALDWPAANFFESEPQFQDIDHRLVTEQCFNPSFSSEKLSAIRIYDILSSFQLNNIGLGFYPGFIFALDQARSVEKGGRRSDASKFPGEADFDKNSGTPYTNNLYCMAAAEREVQHLAYKFPTRNRKFESGIVDQNRPLNRLYPGTSDLDNEYLPYMEARDVIWSRAVNSVSNSKFDDVLTLVGSSLLAANSDTTRGSLIDAPVKYGIFISGDVPKISGKYLPDSDVKNSLDVAINGLKTSISNFHSNVNFIFALFPSDSFLNSDGSPNVAWSNYIEALEEYLEEKNASQPANGKLLFKVIVAANPAKLADEITALMLLEKRTVMISK